MKNKILSLILIFLFLTGTLIFASDVYADNTAKDNFAPSYSSDKTGLDVGGVLGIPSGLFMRYCSPFVSEYRQSQDSVSTMSRCSE
jgi:hypothetical protein